MIGVVKYVDNVANDQLIVALAEHKIVYGASGLAGVFYNNAVSILVVR